MYDVPAPRETRSNPSCMTTVPSVHYRKSVNGEVYTHRAGSLLYKSTLPTIVTAQLSEMVNVFSVLPVAFEGFNKMARLDET